MFMSKFEINVESIKKEGAELNSEKDRLLQLANAMDSVDLRGITGSSQMPIFQEQIDSLKTRVRKNGEEITAAGDALGRITAHYENCENNVVSALGTLSNSDGLVSGGAIGVGVIGAQNVTFPILNNEVSDLGDAIDDLIPNRGLKKIAKNTLKEVLKGAKPGSEKILDIRDIVNKLEDGDVFGALEKAPGLIDIKAWDFKKLKDVAKGSKDFSGILDTAALKFETTMKTMKLVTDSDGYINRYKEQYESQAMEYLKKGNLLGTIHSISSEFVQTVGKGTVDVACQVASSSIDSLVKTATFGLVDLSTINAALEDSIGFSPGTMFNATTKVISDGVDYVLDDLIPGAGKVVSNITGNAVKTGGKIIDGGINFLKKLF
ncbi:hypothetical protein SAMN02910292_02586 [Lachnospiraceae bacterium XBB2008]|nr:hypothetical protein SAMN02910292_02586 [Lachnospiraceae bacterium XBB2008]